MLELILLGEIKKNMQVPTASLDLLRRFSPTPLGANLWIMGRTIRIETNSSKVLEQTCQALQAYGALQARQPEFLWRIVCESDSGADLSWPEMTAFSKEGLSFVNIGQLGFLAVDLNAREAVGFLTESLVADELGFVRPFLAMLFSMSARGLRLMPLSAACVGCNGKGLIILGPPESGKTASSYFAGKLGLEFHADQVVFLDAEGKALRAWGEFWPAVFHPEAQQYLSDIARPFHYQGRKLLYLEKPRHSCALQSTIPAGCVFLERHGKRGVRLSSLDRAEFRTRFKESLLFQDGEVLQPEAAAIWRGFESLPAYHLSYGSDPRVAAILLCDLLNGHRLVKVNP